MSALARCPACGGPVTFKVGTALVAVCPYCNSVVGRSDKGLEDLGKVADLVETGSPLDVWVKGRFEGVPFQLTGRVQYHHPAGGLWDEWYAAFNDGRWGWLAEAQGRFYLTFSQPAPQELPGYETLELGRPVKLADGRSLIVAEKNRGTVGGAKGEIPYRLIPGSTHPFADLSGPGGAFATLDYSESTPAVYAGREVTLDELGIPPKARRKYPGQEPAIQAVQLSCPQCGGPLALRAPDQTLRVGCPNCGALLDVREGQLKLLQSLAPPSVQPVIPLGSVGRRDGVEWTAIGFMQRAARIEGTEYFWEEYLLYQPRLGFRWLTRSDDHWSWVEPLPPGAVTTEGSYARYADCWYRLYQKAKARVVFVVGEFYWRVQAGERVQGRDYVNAPVMLSEEVTKEGGEGEINWSKAVYVWPEQVERMFGLKTSLPRPTDVGPNQPFPHTGIYRVALVLFLAALLLAGLVWGLSPRRVVHTGTYALRPQAGESVRKVLDEEAFPLHARENIRLTLKVQGQGWVHLEGKLVPDTTPPEPGKPRRPASTATRSFTLTAWPDRPSHVYLGAVPEGRYALQYDARWYPPTQDAEATVTVQEGVPHPMPLVLTLLALGGFPLFVGLYQIVFEVRRWQNSSVG